VESNKKTHYSIKDKAEIIEKETYLSEENSWEIATRIDHLTFRGLKELIKALQVIAKGKP